MNLTTATPAEIDAAWFPLMAATQNAETGLSVARQSIHGTEAVIARREAAVAVATAAEAPYRGEWNRRSGWTRTYLAITNGKGHVHASTSCSTCYITTRFAVLADLSGLDHDAVVSAIGEDACTVCFPGAPVTPRTVFTVDELRDRAEQAERAAELAAKRAKAAEKAITAADGSPLLDDEGRPVKTAVAAQRTLAEVLFDLAWYGEDHPYAVGWSAFAGRAALALAAKQGADARELLTAAQVKASKKASKLRAA